MYFWLGNVVNLVRFANAWVPGVVWLLPVAFFFVWVALQVIRPMIRVQFSFDLVRFDFHFNAACFWHHFGLFLTSLWPVFDFITAFMLTSCWRLFMIHVAFRCISVVPRSIFLYHISLDSYHTDKWNYLSKVQPDITFILKAIQLLEGDTRMTQDSNGWQNIMLALDTEVCCFNKYCYWGFMVQTTHAIKATRTLQYKGNSEFVHLW